VIGQLTARARERESAIEDRGALQRCAHDLQLGQVTLKVPHQAWPLLADPTERDLRLGDHERLGLAGGKVLKTVVRDAILEGEHCSAMPQV
jgi:hypothetical protein